MSFVPRISKIQAFYMKVHFIGIDFIIIIIDFVAKQLLIPTALHVKMSKWL